MVLNACRLHILDVSHYFVIVHWYWWENFNVIYSIYRFLSWTIVLNGLNGKIVVLDVRGSDDFHMPINLKLSLTFSFISLLDCLSFTNVLFATVANSGRVHECWFAIQIQCAFQFPPTRIKCVRCVTVDKSYN